MILPSSIWRIAIEEPWVSNSVDIEVILQEKRIFSLGSSSARASNNALRCTVLGPICPLHQAQQIN